MARRRHVEVPPNIRSAVAAHLRESHDRFGDLRLVDDPATPGQSMAVRLPGPSRHSRLADAIDAGEPVDLPGWKLKRFVPEVDVYDHARLEPDGSVTPLRRVHRAGIVEWVPRHG